MTDVFFIRVRYEYTEPRAKGGKGVYTWEGGFRAKHLARAKSKALYRFRKLHMPEVKILDVNAY